MAALRNLISPKQLLDANKMHGIIKFHGFAIIRKHDGSLKNCLWGLGGRWMN